MQRLGLLAGAIMGVAGVEKPRARCRARVCSVVVTHHLPGFQLVNRAAIRTLGVAIFGHVQIHLGVAVPQFHIGFWAGAKHTALGVQVGGQQFDSLGVHGGVFLKPRSASGRI